MRPYRYTIPDVPVSELPVNTERCKTPLYFLNEELEVPNERYCRTTSIERTANYTLFFLELDEQGRFYDRRQFESLVRHLNSLRDKPPNTGANCPADPSASGDASVVTYVHGWRHNAKYGDWNVERVRRQLDAAAELERDKDRSKYPDCERQVIGVYLGWRGLSAVSGELHNKESSGSVAEKVLSLWELSTVADRKNTAHNMAVGSARELFGLLRAFQEHQNTPERRAERCRTKTSEAADPAFCKSVRLAIVGHSFGGLIVYNAVAGQIIDSVVRGTFAKKSDSEFRCDATKTNQVGSALVSSYADLILLINPAIEGARYEALHGAVNARALLEKDDPASFCPNQRPVLVSVTATGDIATRAFFPLVRIFNTIFESAKPKNPNFEVDERAQNFVAQEETKASANTFGHIPRYTTHTMSMTERPGTEPPRSFPILTAIQNYQPSMVFVAPQTKQLQVVNAPSSPIWNISVTSSEIIPDHGTITKAPFLCFVDALYSQQVTRDELASGTAPKNQGTPPTAFEKVNQTMAWQAVSTEKRPPLANDTIWRNKYNCQPGGKGS
jgi:hypothetical protein